MVFRLDFAHGLQGPFVTYTRREFPVRLEVIGVHDFVKHVLLDIIGGIF